MKIIEDAELIHALTRDRLVEVGSKIDEWKILYKDRIDGSYWELSHPQSHLHGGGPPRLTQKTAEEAATAYELKC